MTVASSEAVPAASTEVLSKSKRKRLKRKAAATATASSGLAKPSNGNPEQESVEKPIPATELQSSPGQAATTAAKKKSLGEQQKKQQLNTSLEDGATPVKKKKFEKKPQKVQQDSTVQVVATPAKKKKLEEQSQTPKQESGSTNTNNPFAKQSSNNNDGKLFLPVNNRFKNKQKGAKAGPVGRASGGNPFKNAGKSNGTDGGSFQQREKRDFKPKGKPNNVNGFSKNPGKFSRTGAPRREGDSFKPRGKRDFKAKGKPNNDNPNGLSDDRLKAYGINPRKFRNQQKYGKKKD